MSRTTSRADIYAQVTSHIISELERGVRPWLKPWNAELAGGRITRPLRHAGQPYQGINILILWAASESSGYASPYWLSFKQCRELGGHVRKGEKGTSVVYASSFKATETSDDGQETEATVPFLKEYTVFCADQCDGLPLRFAAPLSAPTEPLQRIERADAFFANVGATILTGGSQAYYAPGADHVRMPPFEAFRDAESHAATLAHELTHWTSHPSRLNRDFGRKRWGDEGYAMEELVAEMGSAFLGADLELPPELRDDHASYISSWLKVLKQDKRAIFTAASHASKAVEFLHGKQPTLAA